MKIPRRSRRFLDLTAALDAEFVRLGRPAIPGRSADLLAQAIEGVARQLGVDPAYALRVYIRDDWPTKIAAKIVAQLEEHDEAIGFTAPIELPTCSALALANALAVAAAWTLRYAASDLMEARHALPATGALRRLAETLEDSACGLVSFGGRPLAEARLALVATIGKMRTYECQCADHAPSDGQPCPTSVMLSERLLESLHSIGGAMPAPDQQQRRRHPMDDPFDGAVLGLREFGVYLWEPDGSARELTLPAGVVLDHWFGHNGDWVLVGAEPRDDGPGLARWNVRIGEVSFVDYFNFGIGSDNPAVSSRGLAFAGAPAILVLDGEAYELPYSVDRGRSPSSTDDHGP